MTVAVREALQAFVDTCVPVARLGERGSPGSYLYRPPTQELIDKANAALRSPPVPSVGEDQKAAHDLVFAFPHPDDLANGIVELLTAARAQERAVLAALPQHGWQDMKAYPRDRDHGAETDWGPEVLVQVDTQYGPVNLIVHLEADMWLARAPCNPLSWEELETLPARWQPLPPPPAKEG